MKKALTVILFALTVNILNSQELKLATDVWEPFRIKKRGKLIGIDIDIIKLMEQKLDQKISVIAKPWARCLKDMEKGSADLMIGLAYTDERAKYIDYIMIPYYEVSTAFFAKEDINNIETYKDLYTKKVGFVNGSSYFAPFDNDEMINKVALPRETMLITMLLKGNIDLLVGTEIQVEYELKEKGLSDIINPVKYKPGNYTKLYIGISKKSDLSKRKNEIEAIIKEIVESGIVNSIVGKYKD